MTRKSATPLIGKHFVTGKIIIAHAMVFREFRSCDFPHNNYTLSGSGLGHFTMLTSRMSRVAL